MKFKIYIVFIKIISKVLLGFDYIFKKIFNVYSFLPYVHDSIENQQYYIREINKKNIKFFCPSRRSQSRVDSLFYKEPETIDWVNKFQEENGKVTFWDIGANIGLYSLYAAIKFDNINVVAFEPSTSNTRTLSRNISINNLFDKIRILSLPLSDIPNKFSYFNETKFSEGSSISTFHYDFDYAGNILGETDIKNKYQLYGTTIDDLVERGKIISPNYIKIDVDGLEYLILKGAVNTLKNSSLKGLLIEKNSSLDKQNESIDKILSDNGFKKTISTNARLINNSNYKLKKNESTNDIYEKI